MKAIVNTSLLAKEFKRVAPIMAKNNVIPITECIKMTFEKGGVTIMATDLETTFISKVDCECKNPFSIIVDFVSISDIFNKLYDEPVTISETEKGLTIHGDTSKFNLPKGGKEEEFPKIPDEEFLFSVDVDTDFFSALYCADTCKNPDNVMVRTNTPCLHFKKDVLTVVGTDAFLLYKKDLKVKTGKLHQSLPSGKFVQAVKSLPSGKLFVGEKFVKIEYGDISIITRLQDNKYCDYEVLFQQEINFNVIANRVDLIGAITRAAVTSSKSTRMCALQFNHDSIKIQSQDIDFGKEGEDRVKAEHTVDIEAIGVNSKQLLHILDLFDSEEVEMAITTPTKSIYLKQKDDPTVLCLLQPLMINQ